LLIQALPQSDKLLIQFHLLQHALLLKEFCRLFCERPL
jgi:hypothetical protein